MDARIAQLLHNMFQRRRALDHLSSFYENHTSVTIFMNCVYGALQKYLPKINALECF